MNDSAQEPVVGIDLGTTYSLVGCVRHAKVELLTGADGEALLPSVVGMGQAGNLLVGRAARNQRLIDPDGTVVSIKRKMGEDTLVRVGQQKLSPAQVSALVLGTLLDWAEAALGRRPTRAIITVPAFFNDAQRQATREAGAIAGLVVERLVNEPTAAALNYQTGSEQTILLYDFGGGTFDVSILNRDTGLLEVRTSRGDTHLGGTDIDQALTNWVLDQLGVRRSRVASDARAMTRLSEAVERAKIALSERQEVRLFEPFLLGEGAETISLDLRVGRADFERVAAPFVDRTLACIDAALGDAGLTPGDLQRVILVGGSCKIPLVQRRVAEHLKRPVICDADADRAVALGASLLAGRASGLDIDEVLVDITPHTLGVGVVTEINLDDDGPPASDEDLGVAPVIPRDTVVPVERTLTAHTMIDDQLALYIPVVQGEQPRVGGNSRLGVLEVAGLPPSQAGSPVKVQFNLDLSGVLEVSATHVMSGIAARATISDSPYRLSAQQRRNAQSQVQLLRQSNRQLGPNDSESSSDANDLAAQTTTQEIALAEALMSRAARALGASHERRADAVGSPSAAAVERVRQACDQLKDAVRDRAPNVGALADQLADALLDLI